MVETTTVSWTDKISEMIAATKEILVAKYSDSQTSVINTVPVAEQPNATTLDLTSLTVTPAGVTIPTGNWFLTGAAAVGAFFLVKMMVRK